MREAVKALLATLNRSQRSDPETMALLRAIRQWLAANPSD